MPKDVELSFDDAGLHVTVGKEKESIGWKKLRVANEPGMMIVFSDARHGYMLTNLYFGSTERTIFCICKRKDRRDELVYAGWQIRQLNGERSRRDKQLEEKDKKVVAGAYHSKENSSVYRDGLCGHPAFR